MRRKSGEGRKTFYKIVTAMSFHTVCKKFAAGKVADNVYRK